MVHSTQGFNTESDGKGSHGYDEWGQARSRQLSWPPRSQPTREGDGKVDQEVGLEVALISPPGHTYTPGVPEEWSGLHRCNLSLQRCQPT